MTVRVFRPEGSKHNGVQEVRRGVSCIAYCLDHHSSESRSLDGHRDRQFVEFDDLANATRMHQYLHLPTRPIRCSHVTGCRYCVFDQQAAASPFFPEVRPMQRVLLAPDKFKGTLAAADVAAHVAAGIATVRPNVPIVRVPVADGGDGTLVAAETAGFTRELVTATGPTGKPVVSAYARRGNEAVIELAEVSGLAQLPDGRKAPLTATSRGTGELVKAALDAGCRHIVIGIGGSACTDGGAGLVEALGARVIGAGGERVGSGGAALAGAVGLDLSGLHPGLASATVIVACDVNNPLLGPRGAATVYGPQKGADPGQVEQLEAGLACWARLVTVETGVDHSTTPGAGAAGGVGFATLALLGATLQRGIDLMLELTGFHAALETATLVITGEGSLDIQTLDGKAPAGVAAAAREAGIPVVVVAGRVELTPAQLRKAGFAAVYSLTGETDDPEECFRNPGPLLERIGARIATRHLPASRTPAFDPA